MGRKLNLSHLSEGECRQILDVIQRDFSIRQKEKERLVKLQKSVKDEEQKRLVLSRQKQFNEKYCICCFSSFGRIFNKRSECKTCGFFVCRDCFVRPEGSKVMMCLGCSQQRELQVQICEWFYGQIRSRFRRFGSAKVVRSLYKRGSQSSDGKESEGEQDFSPSCQDLLSKEASQAFLKTLEKQTGTADTDKLGVPYKLLLENQDWLPLMKPRMLSVAVQAPEDVLPDALDSRQALEDFVFNLPPEEEELGKSKRSERQIERRNSGPEVVVLDPEGEPVAKGADSSRKVHFGEMPTPTKSKESSLTSATGAAYHVLSPIEEVLSSPEAADKHSDSNRNSLDGGSSSSGDSLMDRASVDRLSLGDEEKRVRADSSSTISPHDWDSGIHMSLCLSQDGGWEVAPGSASGMDHAESPLDPPPPPPHHHQAGDFAAAKFGGGSALHDAHSGSMDSFASMSLASLDANDTLDSLETHYNSIHSDMNTPDISDEFVSSSSTVVETRTAAEENEGSMSSMGIEIEQLTLSRSSSEETLKTDDDDDDDIEGRVGDLTMEEFLDQLTSLSLSVTSESADENARDLGIFEIEEDIISPSLTEETSLSSIEDLKQEEFENLNHRMKIAEERQPLLAEDQEDLEVTKGHPLRNTNLVASADRQWKASVQEVRHHGRVVEPEEKHSRCTKSHHHHSSRSHVHDPATRSKNPYKRSKSNDDFMLSGRSGDVRSKSNGSKGHRRDGEPATKCTKESHHHGKHHERSPSNRFIRYDSLPLVVEVFEAEGNYHWHHHSHRDFRQFSRESDSNDSEPSSQVASKPSRSGAKLVRAPHLSPKSSYEEDPSQSRQLSVESNTTEDTMPKSTSQSSGPTTPESRRDSQMAGLSSDLEDSSQEQRSPDHPLHYSPVDQSNSRQPRHSHPPSRTNLSSMDFEDPIIKDDDIHDIDSMRETAHTRGSNKSKNNEQRGAPSYRADYSPESQFSRTVSRRQESLTRDSPVSAPSQSPVPLLSSSGLPSKDSLHLPSPSSPPAPHSPGASPITTPSRMAALRKDIQELANLTKKVSITQEEMLQSAEEVLTSAHKMSSIQTQVEELEDVLDSLERTVIGESSSLFGSSSENEDSVVGPHEQVVEDMQLLEQQLACSHTEDENPSETNAATAVRMITTTALKLLSTTEDAMKTHSANMDSEVRHGQGEEETGRLLEEVADREVETGDGEAVAGGGNRRNSEADEEEEEEDEEEVEEMCAGSSTDGSRPSSLSLDDGRSGGGSHHQKLDVGPDSDLLGETDDLDHHHQAGNGVSFLHLHHSGSDQDSPQLIATLMYETDEDIRNGNNFSAADSPYQNGDGDMLHDDVCGFISSPSPTRLQSGDGSELVFDPEEGGAGQERQAERRRRKERKLRKSSSHKSAGSRAEEMNLLLYNEMAGLEEKVYLSAGKVFTLEERLQRLQESVNQVDRTSPEESIVDLEDKLALTMAQVAQSESQVAAVEAQIAALQQSRQTGMDMFGCDSEQFGNVSVAMCTLASPEPRHDPYAYRYGSSVQIQIPRERVDSPIDVVLETAADDHAITPDEDGDGNWEGGREIELEMGILKDAVECNGGQTESFGVERCEVSVELRPIKAVIVRYLQEGDDDSLWPDFRFTRNKRSKHAGEKRSKIESGLAESHYSMSNMDGKDEHHISTLEMSLGYHDGELATGLDGQQEVDVSIPINDMEEVTQA